MEEEIIKTEKIDNEIKVEEDKPEYIEQYNNMVKYLKVIYNDTTVLHHNISSPSFFGDHENLGELYEDIAEIIDNLVELGMTIGILEPAITESIAFQTPIDVKFRNQKETFEIVSSEMVRAIELMETAKIDVPADVRNKIEEHEHKFRTWYYKVNMLLSSID